MRRILFLTCIGSLALALTASGASRHNKPETSAKRTKGAAIAHTVSSRGGSHLQGQVARSAKTSRHVSGSGDSSPLDYIESGGEQNDCRGKDFARRAQHTDCDA